MMMISYDEFNELQIQQKIRDYSQDVLHTLICLEQLVKRKDKKQIRDMMSCIHSIENEAVENISKMIGGDQQTMKVIVMMKKADIINTEFNNMSIPNVINMDICGEVIDIEFYEDMSNKKYDIKTTISIPRKHIKDIHIEF